MKKKFFVYEKQFLDENLKNVGLFFLHFFTTLLHHFCRFLLHHLCRFLLYNFYRFFLHRGEFKTTLFTGASDVLLFNFLLHNQAGLGINNILLCFPPSLNISGTNYLQANKATELWLTHELFLTLKNCVFQSFFTTY